ncbi:GNAT family N-acetyltransferase [Haloplanus sp. GCM10025708]|uniref:GNAT family N-acetyltransferase n=1 Tax=Haloferacaceae TaxID=1644056 RepID=UPI00361CFAEC
MSQLTRPEFEEDARKRIYAYVERHGIVDIDDVADQVDADEEAFTHHLSMLKRDGYLEERGGTLRVELDVGEADRYESDGLSFAIRPAQQTDLSGILGVMRRVAEEERYIVAQNVAELVDYEGALLRHSTVESRVFFVATVDDDVVGWLHFDVPELEKLRHTAELTVGVLEEYRRRGIGSRLMDHGLGWAERAGYRKVYNSLPSTNRSAIQFLVDHGWETEAIRRDHYRMSDGFVDEVMMATRF